MSVLQDTRTPTPIPQAERPPRTPRAPRLPPPLPHLPGLDGLRALAVSAVLLYHLDLPWIPGGFLGVDVFFVLSGFLITTLVLEEVERTGRLDYRKFYLRRARRLLPALWLLLLTVSVFSLFFLREELAELRGDVTAALLYVSNWWYILADQSYFEFTGRPALLQHLWSLAVEEQFYLVWPAIVVFAMVRGRRRRVRRTAFVLAVASTIWMAWLSIRSGYPVPNDPSRVYYGTDTHAMGLLIGATLATVWVPWRRWSIRRSWLSRPPVPYPGAAALIDAAGLVGLIGVVWFFLSVGEFSDFLYRGGFLVLALSTALGLAALANPAGLLSRALAVQPLRYLGERSYGIYMWHWPVFMVTRPGFELSFDGLPSVLLRVGITLVLAELSYRFVEMPIRRGAIGSALRQAREPTPEGHAMALRVVTVPLVLALVVWAVALGMSRAPAAPPSVAAAAEPAGEPASAAEAPAAAAQSAESAVAGATESAVADEVDTSGGGAAADDSAAAPEASRDAEAAVQPGTGVPPAATPTPTTQPQMGPGRTMSVFGDSVVFGAKPYLRKAGATVKADEGLAYPKVLAAVRKSSSDGSLRATVVLHVGNNGAIAEDDLQSLIDELPEHRVVLVTVAVPRGWEDYNNELFARLAEDNPNVTLADWNAQALAHPSWLYQDKIHLTEPEGRQAYTQWLLEVAQP